MKAQRRSGHIRNQITIVAAIVALVTLVHSFGLLEVVELKVLDMMFELRGTREPRPEIVVVAVDDATLAELGMEWPLPSTLHAQLITQLQSDGAKFIGIVFPTPDSARDYGEDTYLVRSIEQAGVVWLPEEFSDTKDPFFAMRSLLEPAANYAEVAAGVAFVNVIRDKDGFVRRVRLVESYQAKPHYHMIAAAYAHLEGGEWQEPIASTLLINYSGPPRTYKTVSYYQVAERLLPPRFFENKAVLVGLTSPKLGDSYPTPFSGQQTMSRAEIIANGLGTLLSQDRIEPTNLLGSVLLTVLVASVITAGSATQPVFRGSVLTVLTGALYSAIAFLLFAQGQVWLPVAYPMLTLVLIYGAVTVYRYSLEQRQKRELRRLFGRYVSEEVVADILRQSDAQALGGRRLELTVLFSDIRGFTTLSQELSPERVVAILNQYLAAMTEIIFQNRGTIDKFLGDGVMVLFGAPLTCPDAPFRAVNTAIQMQEKLQELGVHWEREGVGPLRIGIGIHTGDAVVGNIGSPRRMSYTAIGDTVNIASRLQDLTKTLDSSIIVSEAVYHRIKERVAVKPLGPVILRGRDGPIDIYGIVVQPPK